MQHFSYLSSFFLGIFLILTLHSAFFFFLMLSTQVFSHMCNAFSIHQFFFCFLLTCLSHMHNTFSHFFVFLLLSSRGFFFLYGPKIYSTFFFKHVKHIISSSFLLIFAIPVLSSVLFVCYLVLGSVRWI